MYPNQHRHGLSLCIAFCLCWFFSFPVWLCISPSNSLYSSLSYMTDQSSFLRLEGCRKTESKLTAFRCTFVVFAGLRELRLTKGDWLWVFSLTKNSNVGMSINLLVHGWLSDSVQSCSFCHFSLETMLSRTSLNFAHVVYRVCENLQMTSV